MEEVGANIENKKGRNNNEKYHTSRIAINELTNKTIRLLK